MGSSRGCSPWGCEGSDTTESRQQMTDDPLCRQGDRGLRGTQLVQGPITVDEEEPSLNPAVSPEWGPGCTQALPVGVTMQGRGMKWG